MAAIGAMADGSSRRGRLRGNDAMKPFTTLAILLFALMALAHLYRLLRPFDVVVAGTPLPLWVSIAGLVVTAGLALMLWREARR